MNKEIHEHVNSIFYDYFGVRLNSKAYEKIAEWIERYGSEEVITSVYIACERYDDFLEAFTRIGGVLFNREKTRKMYFTDSEE